MNVIIVVHLLKFFSKFIIITWNGYINRLQYEYWCFLKYSMKESSIWIFS